VKIEVQCHVADVLYFSSWINLDNHVTYACIRQNSNKLRLRIFRSFKDKLHYLTRFWIINQWPVNHTTKCWGPRSHQGNGKIEANSSFKHPAIKLETYSTEQFLTFPRDISGNVCSRSYQMRRIRICNLKNLCLVGRAIGPHVWWNMYGCIHGWLPGEG
jgi:hypothetical protein